MAETFDPKPYLIKLQNKDYLPVQARVLWLRTEHPDAAISTLLKEHDYEQGFALFEARISLEHSPIADGMIPIKGFASGWGSETRTDFRDYIEKAETKAVGRALANLGFGTQFCNDLDEGERQGEKRVVDAPQPRQEKPVARVAPRREQQTQKQLDALQAAVISCRNAGAWADTAAELAWFQAYWPNAIRELEGGKVMLAFHGMNAGLSGMLLKALRDLLEGHKAQEEALATATPEEPPVDPE